MFKIKDGRSYFYQWDTDRFIEVEDKTVDRVHFCNRAGDCSLVVEVVDGLAPVPNILLQKDLPIRVYAYCNDGHTKTEELIKVRPRTKPADYVYTETEVKTFGALEERMGALEERMGSLDIPTEDSINELISGAINTLDIPTDEDITTLINNALGVIENGTY